MSRQFKIKNLVVAVDALDRVEPDGCGPKSCLIINPSMYEPPNFCIAWRSCFSPPCPWLSEPQCPPFTYFERACFGGASKIWRTELEEVIRWPEEVNVEALRVQVAQAAKFVEQIAERQQLEFQPNSLEEASAVELELEAGLEEIRAIKARLSGGGKA
jgi:hypothetical protein